MRRIVTAHLPSCRTTNSYHHFHTYNNLIKDFSPEQSNQVWVTDITYIRTINGFCYLALVTDLYSRKIVGYDTSDSLELVGALRALKMAIRNADNLKKLIHHSDRGVQYCSYAYTGELLKRDIKISMTEENHCYENAVAERVNGILKDEFYLDQTFYSTRYAKMAVKNAIKLYNNERLHLSLVYKTPNYILFYGVYNGCLIFSTSHELLLLQCWKSLVYCIQYATGHVVNCTHKVNHFVKNIFTSVLINAFFLVIGNNVFNV